LIDDANIFFNSEIEKKLDIKNPSFEQVKSYYLNLKLEADLQRSPGQSQVSKVRL